MNANVTTLMTKTARLAVTTVLALLLAAAIPAMAIAQSAPVRSGFAQDNAELHRMLELMGIYEVLSIMGDENMQSAAGIEAQMFPGAGGAPWREMVADLHSDTNLIADFERAFPQDALSAQDVAAITEFGASDIGRRIIAAELAARRTFMDDAAIDDAIAGLNTAIAADLPRLDILQRFTRANMLVERNVSGALNLRVAFYRGLSDGGAFEDAIPEDMILAEVWSQEPEVRRTTVERLFAFQLLAYENITDAELERYVALSESPAGRAVNTALFLAFDTMLGELSYGLGAGAAIFVVGEDT